ncbi:MAG: hypothetical protein AVO34_11560 [Firmicutes bacterium ML8_F2]|nr:MAG: hypothetical protein AVO34_11560 [Firmicutes bacterium ML8_F2]
MFTISFANRGSALEELVELANIQYRRLGIAVMHKVPSKWIPIRNKHGKLISAKIEEKAAVDFMGRYFNIPIAFDVKSVLKDTRWYLKNIEHHQLKFLVDWETGTARSYVLLGFWKTEEFFFLPFRYVHEKYLRRLAKGPASLKLDDLREEFPIIKIQNKGIILDYFSACYRREDRYLQF